MTREELTEYAEVQLAKVQKYIAELEAELTRIREALAHNCDQSGCPSVGPHIVGDIPPHRQSLYQETIRALRAQLAEALKRIAELEAAIRGTYCAYCGKEFPIDDSADDVTEHIRTCEKHPMRAVEARAEKAEAERDQWMDELKTLRCGIAEVVGWKFEGNPLEFPVLETIRELKAERDAARAKVEEVKGKLEVAAEWIRDYGMELCACCGRWCDMGEMTTGEDGGPYCCDCYESWRFECSSTGCTYRMAELEDGADTRCPECGEVMVERCVKEGLS